MSAEILCSDADEPADPLPRRAPFASFLQGQRIRAIALMCAAAIFFAALDTSAKSLSLSLPAIEIVWARYIGSAIVGILAVRPLRIQAFSARGARCCNSSARCCC